MVVVPEVVSIVAVARIEHEDGDSDQNDDPSRLSIYGVEIKRAKIKEADEVVAQAKSAAAQGRKANPYAGQRGRNSWRDALYAAAYAAHALAPMNHAIPAPVSVLTAEAAPAKAAIAMEPPIEPSPVSPRAVPYTRNAAQSATAKRPDEKPTPRVTETPSARKAPTGEAMHRPQPIQGRVVAHGQASPMPDGLKEAVQRMEEKLADPNQSEEIALSIGPVTALKPLTARRPDFLGRRPQS
jgi:hypothetical protein